MKKHPSSDYAIPPKEKGRTKPKNVALPLSKEKGWQQLGGHSHYRELCNFVSRNVMPVDCLKKATKSIHEVQKKRSRQRSTAIQEEKKFRERSHIILVSRLVNSASLVQVTRIPSQRGKRNPGTKSRSPFDFALKTPSSWPDPKKPQQSSPSLNSGRMLQYDRQGIQRPSER